MKSKSLLILTGAFALLIAFRASAQNDTRSATGYLHPRLLGARSPNCNPGNISSLNRAATLRHRCAAKFTAPQAQVLESKLAKKIGVR